MTLSGEGGELRPGRRRSQQTGVSGHFDAARGLRVDTGAIVVLPEIGKGEGDSRDAEARLEEAVGLARAIWIDVRDAEIIRIRGARPATLFGKGQLERLAASVAAHEAELVVIDGIVTPIQQRNLEKELKAKVIDRTSLILEIFGERAQTSEGALQVELAHLNYQASRLVRTWTHLERQRGGFGFLGGPGETQIETDRRLIRDRIAKLRRELEEVRRTRALHRRRRQKAPYPVVALVGYTNAGKSTLFNRLTGAEVTAENMLFATLDPTMRSIQLPGFDKVILSDTVGFVSSLPTQLVAAFRATLEEVTEADLIVHVRDIAHPDAEAQHDDVCGVLRDLGVIEGEGRESRPMIEVLNKIDLLDAERRAVVLDETQRSDDSAAVSAVTGEGVDGLKALISATLQRSSRIHDFDLDAGDGARIAWLHENGEVIERRDEDGRVHLRVRLSDEARARFAGR